MFNRVKIGIFGAGLIGKAAYNLLKDNTSYNITIVDKLPPTKASCHVQLDIEDRKLLQTFIKDKTLVINALPYTANLTIYKECLEFGVPYFDFSEDSNLDDWIFLTQSDLSKLPFTMPHCGLAPGMTTVIANHLAKDFTVVDNIRIRVGALSQNATNKLKYHLTWSADGLINEYDGECAVLKDGNYYTVPPLTDYETLILDGREYEAFNTAGGLGTFANSIIENKEERFSNTNVNYKTLRRVGHFDCINFLMNDLKIPKNDLINIIKNGVSYTTLDCVIIFITVNGHINSSYKEKVYTRFFYPEDIYTAIEMTTASGLLTMVELFLEGDLPTIGYYKQEDINFDSSCSTVFGKLYKI